MTQEAPEVVEVLRDGRRESVHRGDAAVADTGGRVLFALGDPWRLVFARSAVKPFQAMAVVETGAADRFGFTPPELAVMSASHGGESHHVQAVASILKRLGLGPEALQCGPHPPANPDAARVLVVERRPPGPLHNNCSGKHAGMLAICRQLDLPLRGYLDPAHPVQEMNRANLALMAGLAPSDIVLAGDGCGAPAYALPLAALARAYARLVCPSDLPGPKQSAARVVVAAMRAHPEMVGGTGRLCTRLMVAAGDRLVAKSGAEGVYCVGASRPAWGLALKIQDGASRAVPPAVIEFLLQLGELSGPAVSGLADLHSPPLRDHQGQVCGALRPVARLRHSRGEERGQ